MLQKKINILLLYLFTFDLFVMR